MAAEENPFPGMNPYLERYWRDLHTSLITYASDTLQETLPDALRARAEARVFLEKIDSETEQRISSLDVIVVERPGWQKDDGGGTATMERPVAKPLKFRVPFCETTQRYLEILDAADGNRVVSMIEFLTPSNKVPGKGRALYLRKREECEEAGVNVVEIDLQRRGRPTTFADCNFFNRHIRPTYHTSVWRANDPEGGECYPMPLREPLPVIAIPLREDDADATLDLQALVDQAYRRGHYNAADFTRRPDPPFSADDEAWIDSVLTSLK